MRWLMDIVSRKDLTELEFAKPSASSRHDVLLASFLHHKFGAEDDE